MNTCFNTYENTLNNDFSQNRSFRDPLSTPTYTSKQNALQRTYYLHRPLIELIRYVYKYTLITSQWNVQLNTEFLRMVRNSQSANFRLAKKITFTGNVWIYISL